jgi:transposase
LSTNEPSRFSRDFKLGALRRMEAGENVSVLARELGVSRKSIYQWRNRYRVGGSNALHGRGRLTKAERRAGALSQLVSQPAVDRRVV